MDFFASMAQPEFWISLLTLTALEIVLGIDNVIFISIVSNKLPLAERPKARNLGLILALFFRLGLLFTITWIITLTKPLFSIDFVRNQLGHPLGISVKDLILMAGGLFLIAKSTNELFHKLEVETQEHDIKGRATLSGVIVQIILVDMVFSFDSILTAVGLVKEISVMVMAVIISMVVMLAFAGRISNFVNNHPSLQVLALGFLIMIGTMLVAEGFHQKFDKGYLYFAMAFSLVIELINMRARKKKKQPIQLHGLGEEAVEDGLMKKL
ncbi:MAG TPA: TerC family protein [Haliscomenobacter sp.]|uniref:TerC family protein n=1 Tax=Haliscomenobacter sp. TaxID=2717303 RepID=UPI001D4AC4C1|nr:TerC family protein [Haliscomenobacter sp.]MBK9488581.1 TerC family protein [Haliscomenobacter sp.]HOY16390.1 TerC family protein [Haliscomenobacter sp.]HPH20078.1 TerC family protein [Haliscomenobacter sp.]